MNPLKPGANADLVFLTALNNMGVTLAERALTLREISDNLGLDLNIVNQNVKKLEENGYMIRVGDKYFVSQLGLIKALSFYS
ncbi:MAG: winged helix-turn-helix domain-containing protein [Candidatus Bathyarchaeota archaeon]|nr:winged helix-turn-helix domain-containing protein [Candidatus Bathyarchaeota archaeon]